VKKGDQSVPTTPRYLVGACEIRARAASCSLAGSNQELTQTTETSTSGLTAWAPSAKALTEVMSSGIAKAETEPSLPDLDREAAAIPMR
jgi:hypothetical protein